MPDQVDQVEAPAEQNHKVITFWVALCPVTPACRWRHAGHITEQFALDASRAHGETDTAAHRHSNWPRFMPAVAGIDYLPSVAAETAPRV